MNKEWSELNRSVQLLLKKRDTYSSGIKELIGLRDLLMKTVIGYKGKLSADDFCAIPFVNAKGYHNKTIVYSLWHIFRIEDIVAHSLIASDPQIFFGGSYRERIGSPIITTGNELVKNQISDFSKQLDINALYEYILEVKQSTERILNELTYDDLKMKVPVERKELLKSLNVVSSDENAVWLIDYWCSKDIRGLIQMPFSRHWIMHIEACERIKSKLKK